MARPSSFYLKVNRLPRNLKRSQLGGNRKKPHRLVRCYLRNNLKWTEAYRLLIKHTSNSFTSLTTLSLRSFLKTLSESKKTFDLKSLKVQTFESKAIFSRTENPALITVFFETTKSGMFINYIYSICSV